MDGLSNLATTLGERIKNNVTNSVSSMTSAQWIRLITIVGAYCLLRPHLVKLAAKVQFKQMEKAEAEATAEEAEQRAKISPNEFRGQRVEVPEDSSDEEESKPAAADWGKKARRRQRRVVRKILEDHENKLADAAGDEEDKDIQEFLVD